MKRFLLACGIMLLVVPGCASSPYSGELKPIEMTPVQAVRQLVKAASRGDRDTVAQFMRPTEPAPTSIPEEKEKDKLQKELVEKKENMTKKCMELFKDRSRREFRFEELRWDAEAMLVEQADVRVTSEAGLKLAFHLLRIGGPFGRWSCYEISE